MTERREVDLHRRVRLAKAILLGGAAGGFLGLLAGLFVGHAILGVLIGAPVVGLVPFLLSEKVGGAARAIYVPTGRSMAPARDFSRAESLAVRGHYDEAIAVYQEAIDEVPSDPDPYVRIATILKDKLDDPEGAADWLRRALREAELRGSWEAMLVRDLAELYRHRIGEPARGAPMLARFAERHEGSPEGEWARHELAYIKRLMAEDSD